MKAIIIIVIAVIILGGGSAASFYFGIFSGGQKTGKDVSTPLPSTVVPARSPLPTTATPVLTPASPPPTPSPTPVPAITPTATLPAATPAIIPGVIPTPVSKSSVNFQLSIAGVSGTGLSRTVNAQITNNGTADAHNVWVKSEVFSQQQKIQLSGQDSLRVDVGTIKAGATAVAQANLSFNLLDGLRIQQNGARFVLTVNSDEGTQTLTWDYTP